MKAEEKRRLVKLGLVFAVVIGIAGVVRPWEWKKPVVEMPALQESRPAAAEAPPVDGETAPTVRPASMDESEGVDLLKRFVRARRRAIAPTPTRDPFFLAEESAAGTSLAALWKAEDAAAARVAAPTTRPDVVPSLAPEVVAAFQRLRLYGTVGSADGGAAIVESVGRVAVGATVPGTTFVLKSIGHGVAVFASGEIVVELSTPKPQGGFATSEKK